MDLLDYSGKKDELDESFRLNLDMRGRCKALITPDSGLHLCCHSTLVIGVSSLRLSFTTATSVNIPESLLA